MPAGLPCKRQGCLSLRSKRGQAWPAASPTHQLPRIWLMRRLRALTGFIAADEELRALSLMNLLKLKSVT